MIIKIEFGKFLGGTLILRLPDNHTNHYTHSDNVDRKMKHPDFSFLPEPQVRAASRGEDISKMIGAKRRPNGGM